MNRNHWPDWIGICNGYINAVKEALGSNTSVIVDRLTRIFNGNFSVKEAREKINEWISAVEGSKVTCFNKFIQTLKKYKKEIAQYFQDRHTSGFVEGFNNKVKVLKRRCYGIFNIKHLFQRISLDFSGYDFFQNNQKGCHGISSTQTIKEPKITVPLQKKGSNSPIH